MKSKKIRADRLKVGQKFRWKRKLWIKDETRGEVCAVVLSTGEIRVFNGNELVIPVKVEIKEKKNLKVEWVTG